MRKPIIEAKGLAFSYEKDAVLKDVSFTLYEQECTAIIGPHGSGKTTLVRILLGLLKGWKGSVALFGTPLQKFREWEKIGYVPQYVGVDKTFPATVGELLSLCCSKRNKQAASMLSIGSLHDKRFTELSGGQKQRVLIALALHAHPRLLILDEPTVGVDANAQHEFYAILKKLNMEQGVTIVLITHDIGMVSRHVDTVLCLNHNVCCQGPAHKANELLKEAYGQDFAVFSHHH